MTIPAEQGIVCSGLNLVVLMLQRLHEEYNILNTDRRYL